MITIYHQLRRLIRFEAYGILFILVGIFGALLTNIPLDGNLGILIVFIASSSAFGFIINDISDVELDARAEKPRNPLADGSLSCRVAWIISLALLGVSFACMALLPPSLIPAEVLALFIFVTYSFFIEVKNIAGLDLIYHALFPALYGLLGYTLYHPLDLTGIVFTVIVGIFGAIGELGNEIRDLEKDRHVRKNTVVIIGEQPAFYLTITLMVVALGIIAVFSYIQPGYLWLLPFVPFGVILVCPILKAMKETAYREKFVDVINVRAIIFATVILIVYLAGRFTGYI